jgi:ribosomal protein S18 acetylase RimI-like enzyme
VDALDEYIHTRVGQDTRRGATVCYVLAEFGSPTMVGYYCLSATSVRLTDLPPTLSKGLPRYPDVPAALLGRLAVDADSQRKGMGELLLMDAVRRVSLTALQMGIVGIVVEAEDERVIPFYERYEFERLGQESMRLLLKLSKIRSIFPGT